MGLERKKIAGYGHCMKTAHDIIEAAGRANVRSRMDVGDRVLQLYIKDDKLPAAWFDSLEQMCGQTLPRHLFSFKGSQE